MLLLKMAPKHNTAVLSRGLKRKQAVLALWSKHEC